MFLLKSVVTNSTNKTFNFKSNENESDSILYFRIATNIENIIKTSRYMTIIHRCNIKNVIDDPIILNNREETNFFYIEIVRNNSQGIVDYHV